MARLNDPALLHPQMRERSRDLESAINRIGMPLQRFETWRSPRRQANLFFRGRVDGFGKPGRRVTFAKSWRSRHQYGFAEDWVFRIGRKWTWREPENGMWAEFTRMAGGVDLQTLDFERPHVQLPDVKTSDLIAGRYPEGGDDVWENNLTAAIENWGPGERTEHGIVLPGAPEPPDEDGDVDLRPEVIVPAGLRYDDELGQCVPESVS